MKKAKLLKPLTMAVSLVCLSANHETRAMEPLNAELERSKLENSVALQFSQLSTDNLLQMSHFMTNLQQSGGDFSSSLFGSNLSNSKLYAWERETNSLRSQLSEEPLWPDFNPIEMDYILNNHLLPKYMASCKSDYQVKSLNVNEQSNREIQKFLLNNEDSLFSMGDSNLIPIILKMITQSFDLKPLYSNYIDSTMQMYGNPMMNQSPFTRLIHSTYTWNFKNSFIMECSGRIGKGIMIHIDKMYEDKINFLKSLRLKPDVAEQHTRLKMAEQLDKELNKFFNVGGSQIYDVTRDAKAIGPMIKKWLTNTRQLALFELQEWAIKGPLLDQLHMGYEMAIAKLTAEDKKMYSGVSLAPYSIGIIPTHKEVKAENCEELIQDVNAHYEPHKKEIGEYLNIKDKLPILKKIVSWIDDIFDAVSKHGRMT